MYTLEFAPDGHTLTAVASLSSPAQPDAQQSAQFAWDYAFEWNVTSPNSVNRIAVLSHQCCRIARRRQQPAAAGP